MKKTAIVFPGQGAQYVGMGAELLQEPCCQETVKTASECLGFDLAGLCLNGPIEELTKTNNSQVALYTFGYCGYQLLKKSMPEGWNPSFVAGLSLGELTALAVAGVFSFTDGLKLVRKRGEFMMKACEDYPGTMASIMGAGREEVQSVINRTVAANEVLTMANLNCPGQIVISGTRRAVEAAAAQAEADGFKVVVLQVSGAFHSHLMESARVRLAEEVARMAFNDPEFPVIANCDAGIKKSGSAIKESIVTQIVSSVLWEDSVNFMIGNGVELFVEPGCGKVLKGLIKRINRATPCLTVESKQDVEAVVSSLCQHVG